MEHDEHILSRGKICVLKRGDNLCLQEVPMTGVFYIISGIVKVFTLEETGKEIIHTFLKRGDFVGAHGVFSQDSSPYSAVVFEDTTVCYFDKENLRGLIHEHPEILDRIMRKMARTLDEAYHRTGSLIRLGVRERMASSLLDLAIRFGDTCEDGVRIRVKLTREELASFLGVAPETAIRFLSEFKKLNYVSESDRQILIHNAEALNQICHKECQ